LGLGALAAGEALVLRGFGALRDFAWGFFLEGAFRFGEVFLEGFFGDFLAGFFARFFVALLATALRIALRAVDFLSVAFLFPDAERFLAEGLRFGVFAFALRALGRAGSLAALLRFLDMETEDLGFFLETFLGDFLDVLFLGMGNHRGETR
jgi:hypothetical protein